jgi:hypothetical protein
MSNVSSSFGNLLGSSSTSLDPNSITSSIDQKKFSIPDASGNYLSLNDVSGNGVDASGNILVNNWSKFASQVFQNFIYTLLFGLIGSNFIWFSVLSTTELDELLPSGKEDNEGNWVPDNFYSCCKDDASKKAAEDKVKAADEKRKAADEKRKAAERTATAATLSDAAKQVKSQQEKDKVSPKQTKDFSPVTNKGPSPGNVEMQDLSSKSVPEQMASQLENANKKGGADLETLKKIKARKNADDNNNTTCPTGPSVDITDIKKLLPYMGMSSNGWPYSETDGIPDWKRQKNAQGYDFLTTQGFLNWFGETVGQSYQTSRGWLKDFIRLFSPVKGDDGDNINLWSWHPIMMIVSFIFFTVGCFSPIITIPIFIILAFKIDWIWGLSTTLLFGLLPTTATIVSGLQFMQFVATFTILPLILDPKGIKLILHCNVTFLTILFGALTVGSAYQTLETTTATTMAIGFLIIIIPSIMKFFNWGQGSSGLKY